MKSGAKTLSNYLVFEPVTLSALLKKPKVNFKEAPLNVCRNLSSAKELKKIESFFGSLVLIDLSKDEYVHTGHAFKHVCRSTGICLSDDCRRALAYCLLNSSILLTRDPASARMADLCKIGHIKI